MCDFVWEICVLYYSRIPSNVFRPFHTPYMWCILRSLEDDDTCPHAGPMLSSELLIYSNQKQDKLKKRMRIEEMVNIHALGNCAFNILLNDGKTLQFKAETNEAYLCWVSNLKAALGRGKNQYLSLLSIIIPISTLFNITPH